MKAWQALVVTATGLAIAACSLVASYDGFHEDKPACGKRVPARPGAGAGGTGGELVAAMSELRFLSSDTSTPLGYDLDGLCTCPDRRACVNPSATDQQCDTANTGIDNAAGKILGQLFPPAADARIQQALLDGRFGLVVRIQDWNGTPDDPEVKVSLYNVASIQSSLFQVDDASLLNPADLGSKYFDTSAYVAGNILVASLDLDFRLEVPNGLDGGTEPTSIVSIPLSSAKLVGRMAKTDRGLFLTSAQIVGRVTATRIFQQLGAFGFCQADPGFAGIKTLACASLDLPTSPAQDGQGRACDALSIAFGATFAPVAIGGHAPAVPASNPCGPEPAVTCP